MIFLLGIIILITTIIIKQHPRSIIITINIISLLQHFLYPTIQTGNQNEEDLITIPTITITTITLLLTQNVPKSNKQIMMKATIIEPENAPNVASQKHGNPIQNANGHQEKRHVNVKLVSKKILLFMTNKHKKNRR